MGCIGNADGECSPCLDVLYGLVCLGEVQNNGVPLLHGAPCGVHDIVADLRQAQDGHSLLLDMSHDIRTPMNAIIGYSELASRHLQETDKLGRYLEKIQICGKELLSMLGNVLDFARIENNKVEMEYTVSNVHECFENCVIMFQQQAESKNQTLSLTEQIMYPYVYMDAPHLSEICFNIISNAIKYTNTGGKITCNVVQESCKKEDWCNMIITIADNGIGMSEEFQKHIFEDFETKNGYKPVSGDMYGGGVFYGEDNAIPWVFEGATLGETGKDAKWDGASAHLRLTESTSGNPGAIYMKEDKSNGIGYIRFWAAFYDTDKKGRIAVYISGDQGESWESVASGLTPEKTLKEFQGLVNRPGNYRVKIAKSENSSDGVNIDNIRISDYLQPSAVIRSEKDDTFSVSANNGILSLSFTDEVDGVDIYTINGSLAFSIKDRIKHISIPLLPGVYIIRSESYIRKIVL